MLIKRSNNIFVIQNLKQKCSLKTANLICIFKIVWFLKAAEQGQAKAQFNLGVLYFNGQGVKQDFVNAKKWFEKAAKQGHAEATEFLADINSILKG